MKSVKPIMLIMLKVILTIIKAIQETVTKFFYIICSESALLYEYKYIFFAKKQKFFKRYYPIDIWNY